MIHMDDLLTFEELIRITLDEMAEEERPDEDEAARIYERVFSGNGKEDKDEQ